MRRRTFLLGATASGLSLAWGSAGRWPFARPPASAGERLASVLEHEESARVVGREYLRAVPGEADPAVLTACVVDRVPGGARAVVEASDGRLRELLLRATADDFRHLRTAEVRGWVLAQTEARLCALAEVYAASRRA